MKYFPTLLVLLINIVNPLFGQSPSYIINGTVTEASGQVVEYATVVIKDNKDNQLLSGTTTDIDGYFELNSKKSDIYVEISFIGFENKNIKDLNFKNNASQLGTIILDANSQQLDDIIVTAEKSTTEFKLDKRVFNVGTDLSSTGASALEVLNNVPSVNVSIEGEVSLRGSSGVQILINGKPSILSDDSSNALGTITADMIEKIEVITNPSAKYEAEGTAGILNIVLKKNEKNGLNGSISVNTGTPHNHSVGLSMNRRSNKFNLFTQLGVGYRELPRDNKNTNIDYFSNTKLTTEGIEYRNEVFYNFILGTDYYINPLNVITLSGSFTYEVEDQPSETAFQFYKSDIIDSEWKRTEVTDATNPKIQYELQYKRSFEDHKKHQLLFSAIGRYFGKEQSSSFSNAATLGSIPFTDQLTQTEFNEGKYTFNLDYTKPINKNWTIETGAQYLDNDVSNDFQVSNKQDNSYVIDSSQTNIFEYTQKVLGVYGTTSYENKLWGIKVGLRLENTNLNTLLVNTNEANDLNFTNLFPSFHTSYKLTEGISFQAGYSRRIFRPRLWDLNPFFNIRNNFNIRTGNPNLLPEFTDSYEVGSIFIIDKTSFNFNIYHRYTTDKIERVYSFDSNVSTSRPENIGTNKATGLELNLKYSPIKKITFNTDANYNIFKREGQFNDQNFDFSADQWSGKLATKYKLSKALDTELTVRYQSREQTVQGIQSGNLFADFGWRYKILKGKGVFSFSVRDIFASRIRENILDRADFYLESYSRRGRFVTFGFSYGFGKGEAMQYSGGKRR